MTNSKNVLHYIFGRGAINKLGEILDKRAFHKKVKG
jgi:hypothetical protein